MKNRNNEKARCGWVKGPNFEITQNTSVRMHIHIQGKNYHIQGKYTTGEGASQVRVRENQRGDAI